MEWRVIFTEYPAKWRAAIDPFTLQFGNFQLLDILGYPHAGNDVFYVRGVVPNQGETKAFLKVERQKTADIEREVSIINRLDLPFMPRVIDYSLEQPKYILTQAMEGKRPSQILKGNEGGSLKYMEAYGEPLAEVHGLQLDPLPASG